MSRTINLFVVLAVFVSNGFCSAVITKLTGKVDVFVYSNQTWQKAKIGLELFEQDKIKTAQSGRAQLVYQDGSVIWIKENTELEISSLMQKSREIKLLSGKIRLKVSQIKQNEQFVARTPVAVASIRGTELIIVQEEENCYLFVVSGKVEFSDINSVGQTEIFEGQTSFVDISGRVSPPKEFTEEDLKLIQDETWYKFDLKETKATEVEPELRDELIKLRYEIHEFVSDLKSDLQVVREYTDEVREADISTGRTLRDTFGNLVRVEQYLLRPDPATIQFLNLTKRNEYTYKGYFTDKPFSQTARIDSFEAKLTFNMLMPDDITDWPAFVVSKGEELRPKSMLVRISNDKDSILTESIYTETTTETGKEEWNTTVKYISGTEGEWLVDTESYDETSGANKWFETGEGVGTGGEDSLWGWVISPKIRLYQDTSENGTKGYDVRDKVKYIFLGTEFYGINNSGKILTSNDFSGLESNPFAVLKEIAIQNTIFCRYTEDPSKILVSETEEITDTVKTRALNEFKKLPDFFSRKNIDVVYTPDILVSVAQKLITQADKLKLTSNSAF